MHNNNVHKPVAPVKYTVNEMTRLEQCSIQTFGDYERFYENVILSGNTNCIKTSVTLHRNDLALICECIYLDKVIKLTLWPRYMQRFSLVPRMHVNHVRREKGSRGHILSPILRTPGAPTIFFGSNCKMRFSVEFMAYKNQDALEYYKQNNSSRSLLLTVLIEFQYITIQ